MDNSNCENRGPMPYMPDLGKCMLLVLIVDSRHTETAAELLKEVGIMRTTAIMAEGSAKRGWLEMLGLWGSEKTVIVGVVREALVYATFQLLHDEFSLLHKGTGIAFTIRLLAHSGFGTLHRMREKMHEKLHENLTDEQIGRLKDDFRENMPEEMKQIKHKMKKKMMAIKEKSEMDPQTIEEIKKDISPEPHVLLMVIVNRGFSGEAIDAAREAGAEGATTLHGRGLGVNDMEKFLNIRVEPEKEVVMIVVKKAIAKAVMMKVTNATNLHTKAHGVCFALPIEDVYGLTPIEGMFK